MVTNKDLVEASAFERRRLVNAFLSGARSPEPEPAAVGRKILGSGALALLLLAGTAASRYVVPLGAGVPTSGDLAMSPARMQASVPQVTGPGRWRGRVGGCTWWAMPRSVMPRHTARTTRPEAASAVAMLLGSNGARPAYACTIVDPTRSP